MNGDISLLFPHLLIFYLFFFPLWVKGILLVSAFSVKSKLGHVKSNPKCSETPLCGQSVCPQV